MSRQANPATIGGFVLGALAILVATIVTLGGIDLFAERDRYSVFFEGSVKGLAVGSAVRFQGVSVGEVVDIVAIAEMLPDQVSIWTETVIEIDRRRFEQRGVEIERNDEESAEWLVEQGLRAQLNLDSLLTGQLNVALLVSPGSQARLVGGDPRYPELPAIPTTLEQLEAKARKLLNQITELPLDEVVANLNASLISFDRLVSDPALASAIQELNHTLVGTRAALGDARKLVQNLDAQVEPLADSTRGTLDRASDALASVEPGSPLNHQLGTALQELSEAAQALRALATTLEQQPNALLFGRTGEP